MTADAAASRAQPAHRSDIGVLGAAALVAGSMIGSGVYLLPATLAGIGSISILGWLAAATAALAIAGVFVWLGSLVPKAEGLPDYVQAGLGPFFGVQTAVLFWTSNWVGLVPVALAAAGALGFLVPALQAPAPRLFVTIAVIWAAVGAAWAGPRIVARIEGLTLVIGLAPVLLVATLGWLFFRSDVFVQSWNPGGLNLASAVSGSALNCFWAFLGLECAAAAAGVVRDPVRNVPRATLLGVGGVAVVYISATAVLMGVLPATELAKSSAPFADGVRATVGAGLGALMAACAMLRAMGCVTGWTLVTAETARTAADSGAFPPLFRTRTREPWSSINLLVVGGLMTAVALVSASPDLAKQFTTVANTVSLLSLYTYTMAAVALLRLSRGQGGGRRAGMVATAVAATICALVLVRFAAPLEFALSLVPAAAAGLLYLWLRRR